MSRTERRARLGVECLEDRTTPAVAVADAFVAAAGAILHVAPPGVLANDDTSPRNSYGGNVFVTATDAVLKAAVPAGEGSVSLNPDGSFDFTPAPGFTGQTGFSYAIDSTILVITSAWGHTYYETSNTATVTIDVSPPPPLVLSGPGGVTAYDPTTGQTTALPSPFGAVAANVAAGDLNRDGVADYAFTPGPGGGPVVRLIDGSTGAAFADVFGLPDTGFRGGLSVAVGAGPGGAPVVAVGAGPGGGPLVALLDGATGQPLARFFAFDPALRTGVTVALADVNGDGVDDVIVGTGPGAPAEVRVIDGTELGLVGADGAVGGPAVLAGFSPFGSFAGGVFVAGGDFDGDRFGDVAVTPGVGGGPVYGVYFGNGLTSSAPPVLRAALPDLGFRGGLAVTARDVNRDGADDVVVTPGPGGGPVLYGFDAVTGLPTLSAMVGDPAARTGGSLG